MFTAYEGKVYVSTALPEEVYAKLTFNKYSWSVPITRQWPLCHYNSVSQGINIDKGLLFSLPADTAEEKLNGYLDCKDSCAK